MKFATTILAFAAVAATQARVLYVRQDGSNLQTFTGALGGIEATPGVDSGNADRPFDVNGATFANLEGALQRSCDQQFNACANEANGGNAAVAFEDCNTQKGT